MPNDRLVRAARREPVDRPPVWFLRQAGRYLPEYRELRKRHSIQEICRQPDLAAQAALTAVRALPGLDGAIIFSDILTLLEAMGAEVAFVENRGPVVQGDPARLHPIDPARDLRGPIEGIRILRREVGDRCAVIGFAGGPFTLASYLLEGGPSRDYLRTKAMLHADPAGWNRLLALLADAVAAHLQAQIDAGAQIVQLFDSWAGALSPHDYREGVLPHNRRILSSLRGAPSIHFATGASGYLELLREAGGDVIGLDWRVDLAEARRRLGPGVAVQGNLDPAALLAPQAEAVRRAEAILDQGAAAPGHIFNLGHGVLPETPLETVRAVLAAVLRRGTA